MVSCGRLKAKSVVVLWLALAGCTTASSSDKSSRIASDGDGGAGSCPILTDGCRAYSCACRDGTSQGLVSGKSPSGSCESLTEACARACGSAQGVVSASCGTAPSLQDAAPDVLARKACDPAGFCNVSASAACKDSSTVRNLITQCPDSGVCPTVPEAAEAACASHGGVDYVVPTPP